MRVQSVIRRVNRWGNYLLRSNETFATITLTIRTYLHTKMMHTYLKFHAYCFFIKIIPTTRARPVRGRKTFCVFDMSSVFYYDKSPTYGNYTDRIVRGRRRVAGVSLEMLCRTRLFLLVLVLANRNVPTCFWAMTTRVPLSSVSVRVRDNNVSSSFVVNIYIHISTLESQLNGFIRGNIIPYT